MKSILNVCVKIVKFGIGSSILICVTNRLVISVNKIDELYSMSPSFNPGLKNLLISNSSETIPWYKFDYILALKLDYINRLKQKKKDQLTYMHHPYEEDKKIVRYLVALPGEWVKDKEQQVYHRIPEGCCWVECLNGDDDSSSWGPVPLALLIGRPLLKVRPFKKFVRGKKIDKNMRNRLKVKERVLNDDNINSFFI